MSLSQELWDTFRKLAALEARTEEVAVLKFALSRPALGGLPASTLLPGEDPS